MEFIRLRAVGRLFFIKAQYRDDDTCTVLGVCSKQLDLL